MKRMNCTIGALLAAAFLSGALASCEWLHEESEVDPDTVKTQLRVLRGDAPAGAILVDGAEPAWLADGSVEFTADGAMEHLLQCVAAPDGMSFGSWDLEVHGVGEGSANNPLDLILEKTSLEISPHFIVPGASIQAPRGKGSLQLPGVTIR